MKMQRMRHVNVKNVVYDSLCLRILWEMGKLWVPLGRFFFLRGSFFVCIWFSQFICLVNYQHSSNWIYMKRHAVLTLARKSNQFNDLEPYTHHISFRFWRWMTFDIGLSIISPRGRSPIHDAFDSCRKWLAYRFWAKFIKFCAKKEFYLLLELELDRCLSPSQPH